MMHQKTSPVIFKELSLQGMKRLANLLAPFLTPGTSLCLWGPLGAGKTTFSRFIVEALNPQIEDVPSPTFTLVQTYESPRCPVIHCDFYRLKDQNEILELGLDEVFYESILLIEWPERMGIYLPHDRLDCHISIDPERGEETTRTVRLEAKGELDIKQEDLKEILSRLSHWHEDNGACVH